jgi:hypothetical protein
MTRGRPVGLAVLLAFALVLYGETSAKPHSEQRRQSSASQGSSAAREPPARLLPAQPVALTSVPSSLRAVCLKNSLLHRICPRLVPRADEPHTSIERLGFCIDHAGRDVVVNGHYARLASSHCVDAGWGYEAIGLPPGSTARRGTTFFRGWDPVTGVLAPPEALLISPPVHVHIEIEASLGSLIGAASWPRGAHPVSDKLLSPKRRHAVSLGWVRWYGRYGQLVLEPVYPFGGEWGGHLIFRFAVGRVRYAITLHAWMPAIRATGNGINRVITFESGASLPRVIATLKAMVGSVARG